MLTSVKGKSVIVIPKFDGFRKWRLPFSVAMRKMCFDAIANAAAKAIGISRSLE